ncbi:hypothetical protein L6V77_19230 [Myxococcota bacterium]|nr:hypothetical protein [Myxococcota bacterium]
MKQLIYLVNSEKKQLARGETINLQWPRDDPRGVPAVGDIVESTESPPRRLVVVERHAEGLDTRVHLRAHTVAQGGASGDSTGAAVA